MKKVLIHDEYIPDYNLSKEEEKKRLERYFNELEKALEELFSMQDTGSEIEGTEADEGE